MEKYYSFNTKRKLILSEETSQELLNIFAQDKSWIIRRMVAESLQTPVFLLKVLSLDGYLPVAHAAILNKNFPKCELPYVLKRNPLLRNFLVEL